MRNAWILAVALVGCGRFGFATGDDAEGPIADAPVADALPPVADALPPVANNGHFVEVMLPTNANLGGIAGANAFCLTTLTNGTWLGKAEANAVGQLSAPRVKAWLCTAAACQNMQPNQPYRYSSTINTTRGGALFTATAQGYLENDNHAFGDDPVFGNDAGFADYYTGRTQTNQPQTATCGDWATTTGSTIVGVNDTPDYGERLSKYAERCNNAERAMCFVDR